MKIVFALCKASSRKSVIRGFYSTLQLSQTLRESKKKFDITRDAQKLIYLM